MASDETLKMKLTESSPFLVRSFRSVPLVKICGLTRRTDIDAALEAGADALGFNFFPGSVRFVHEREAQSWARDLPSTIARVAVVVNPSFEELKRWNESDFIDAIQVHGEDWNEAEALSMGKPVIKAVQVQGPDSVLQLREFGGYAVLADSYKAGRFGGTGENFHWPDLHGAGLADRLIVAGGLNPDNVRSVVQLLRPFAVDVASGVEASPGKKDTGKMRAFVASAKAP